jgi:hypothetical protein
MGARGWVRRAAWLIVLWIGGVGVLGIAAWVLKSVMRAVGLAS